MWEQHSNSEVNAALVRLNDVLCMWERNTGLQSVLILREEGGWQHRSMNGKPDVPEDVTDERLLATVLS